ncbi:hypothetical protein P9112_011928 [Eukaryota sp. TZLM1-RC]
MPTLFVTNGSVVTPVSCTLEQTFHTSLAHLFDFSNKGCSLTIYHPISGLTFTNVDPNAETGLFINDLADVFVDAPPKTKKVLSQQYVSEDEIASIYNEAKARFDESDYQQAIKLIDQALHLRSIHSPSHLLAADIHELSGQHTKAIQHLKKGFSLTKDCELLVRIGRLYEQLDDVDNALDYYSQASTRNDKFATYALAGRCGICRCLISKKQFDKAAQVVSINLRFTENHPESLLCYSRVLIEDSNMSSNLDSKKEALKALIKSLAAGETVETVSILGKLLKSNLDLIDDLIELIGSGPTTPWSLKLIGSQLLSSGYFLPACTLLKKAARSFPDQSALVYELMMALEVCCKPLDSITEALRYFAAMDGKSFEGFPLREVRRALDNVLSLQDLSFPASCIYDFRSVFDLSILQSLSKENVKISTEFSTTSNNSFTSAVLMVVIRCLFSLGAHSLISDLKEVIAKWIINQTTLPAESIVNDWEIAVQILIKLTQSKPKSSDLCFCNRMLVFGDYELDFVFEDHSVGGNSFTFVPILFPRLDIMGFKLPQSYQRQCFVKFASLVSAKSNVLFKFSGHGLAEWVEKKVTTLVFANEGEAIDSIIDALVENMTVIATKRKSTVFGRFESKNEQDFIEKLNIKLKNKVAALNNIHFFE